MIAECLAGLTEREQMAVALSAFVVVMSLASFGLGWVIGDRGRERGKRLDCPVVTPLDRLE